MADTRSFTKEQATGFFVYFDVADEVWPRTTRYGVPAITLGDIDPASTEVARKVATDLSLPWPPDLAEAEEYLLTHGPALRHAVDWKPL